PQRLPSKNLQVSKSCFFISQKELHESRLQCLHLFGCALLLRCGAEVPRAILFSQPLVNAELVYRCVSWKEPRTSAQDFDRTSWDCVLQGALSTFSNTSSFFWTVAVALYLYVTIVKGSPTGTGLLCCFHIVSWGVPLAITIAAVALKKIGYDASNVSVGWCWVNLDAEDRVLWMLLTGKVWEILAYVTLPVLYILIKRHINRAHAALLEYRPILSRAPALQPWTSTADKKLILIPVIFIILRIWSTVRFILTLCNSPAVQNSVLVVLHGIGNTFQGGANCIMFVLCTRVVRARLLSSICCCHHDDMGWPWRSSSSSRQHPDPAESEDVPDPERTKPLLSST
uniref:G protein-coupled receptor 157 n=1 Tax=Gallus gallus TaxID=9031 RepID=A0A8V0YU74_CHICK